jgi:ABC-type cobalamin transport system permease subunit
MMPTFILSMVAKLAGNTVLGWIAPLFTGLGGAIGNIVLAISEILLALTRSPEGRVALLAVALAGGGLYIHYHGVRQGEIEAQAIAADELKAALDKQRKTFKCAAPAKRRAEN